MMAEHKRLVGDLKGQYDEACDWNLRYKAAFKGIHGSELGSFINAMQKPLELGVLYMGVGLCRWKGWAGVLYIQDFINCGATGPPGHEPAVDFLSSTGLSQAVDTVSVRHMSVT